jgi:hypothetical protein
LFLPLWYGPSNACSPPSLLHQINLELRVCHGSSVKKALVKEAISYGAAQLILGVMKNSPLGYVRDSFELWFIHLSTGSFTAME